MLLWAGIPSLRFVCVSRLAAIAWPDSFISVLSISGIKSSGRLRPDTRPWPSSLLSVSRFPGDLLVKDSWRLPDLFVSVHRLFNCAYHVDMRRLKWFLDHPFPWKNLGVRQIFLLSISLRSYSLSSAQSFSSNSAFCTKPFQSLFMHIDEFLVNVWDLRVVQAVGFSVYQALERINLVHYDEINVIVVIVDCTNVRFEEFIVKLVMSSHFQFEVLDGAAEFEEVLDDVFWLTGILSRLWENHQVVLVFSQQIAKLEFGIIDGFIVQEMELLKNIDQINLVILGDVFPDHATEFSVEVYDPLRLRIFFFNNSLFLRW